MADVIGITNRYSDEGPLYPSDKHNEGWHSPFPTVHDIGNYQMAGDLHWVGIQKLYNGTLNLATSGGTNTIEIEYEYTPQENINIDARTGKNTTLLVSADVTKGQFHLSPGNDSIVSNIGSDYSKHSNLPDPTLTKVNVEFGAGRNTVSGVNFKQSTIHSGQGGTNLFSPLSVTASTVRLGGHNTVNIGASNDTDYTFSGPSTVNIGMGGNNKVIFGAADDTAIISYAEIARHENTGISTTGTATAEADGGLIDSHASAEVDLNPAYIDSKSGNVYNGGGGHNTIYFQGSTVTDLLGRRIEFRQNKDGQTVVSIYDKTGHVKLEELVDFEKVTFDQRLSNTVGIEADYTLDQFRRLYEASNAPRK